MSADVPPRVILDAGPLIGFFNRRDHYHADARRGFEQLTSAGVTLVAPLPIVFESYKWLVYHVGIAEGRLAFETIRESMEIVYPGPKDLDRVEAVVVSMPRWAGSLEDVLVAMIGLSTDTPVWTLNYRDLAAFPNLHFWTPR